MTPAQATALAHPVLDAMHFGLNTLLDSRTGGMRLAPGEPVGHPLRRLMRRAALQARGQALPEDSPRRPEEVALWQVLGRLERGFRLLVCVDATPAVEQWPCWHVQVLYGELLRGIARPARPVIRWGGLMCKQGEFLIRRELAGVGEPETTVVLNRARALAAWERVGGREPMALVGRRRLTLEEAQGCLAPAQLAALNGTFGMLEEFTGKSAREGE